MHVCVLQVLFFLLILQISLPDDKDHQQDSPPEFIVFDGEKCQNDDDTNRESGVDSNGTANIVDNNNFIDEAGLNSSPTHLDADDSDDEADCADIRNNSEDLYDHNNTSPMSSLLEQAKKDKDIQMTRESSPFLSQTKKRKNAPIRRITLLEFVKGLKKILEDVDVTTDENNTKILSIPHNLLRYFDENYVIPKVAKMDVSSLISSKLSSSSSSQSHASTPSLVKSSSDSVDRVSPFVSNTTNATTTTTVEQKSLLLAIFLKTCCVLEKAQFVFDFSKEALKYFLATHQRFIQIVDFRDTNSIVRSDKKNSKQLALKNLSVLNFGAILLEYVKGIDMFTSNLNRGEPSDIEALKFIIENNMVLSPTIYNINSNVIIEEPTYKTEKNLIDHEGYIKIPLTAFKRVTLLITQNIILMYDGFQLTVPSASIEKDFTANVLEETNLKKHEYVVLDVLASTKNKIIDILDINHSRHNLPIMYSERIELAGALFPRIKTINISAQSTAQSSCYIQKKSVGFGAVSYVYTRAPLIAAAIGITNKVVHLAFLGPGKTLLPRIKGNISGPTSCMLMTAAFNADRSSNTIKYNNETYEIVGNISQIKLFEKVIPIEIKGANKINNISKDPVSSYEKHKPQTINKDVSVESGLTIETFLQFIDIFRLSNGCTEEIRRLAISKLQELPKTINVDYE